MSLAEEETARRARIEERLARSLGTKKAESAKATKSALTSHEGQRKPPKTNTTNDEQPSRINEKQKPSEYRAPSKTPHQSSSKKSEKDRMRTSLEADSKNGDTKSKKPAERVRKSQANAKKGGGPINFKELLAAAERNKNGGPKIKLKSVLEHGRNSSKNSGSNDDESSRVKKRSSDDKFVSTGQDIKSTKHEKATVKVDSKRSTTKSRAPNGKLLPSVENSSVKQDLKRSSGLVNGSREKQLASKMSSSAGAAASHGKLSNSKYNNPSRDRRPVKEGHLGLKRDRADLKRKRNPYLDEMDDFIDDGDDDDEDDDAPDVSKYIREIFGYDKSRFVCLYASVNSSSAAHPLLGSLLRSSKSQGWGISLLLFTSKNLVFVFGDKLQYICCELAHLDVIMRW